MKQLFRKGDQKIFRKRVEPADLATFESGTVHEVYSSFALARDAEWSGRLFVLDMKEEGEEGIGTRISVEHRSPAFPGEEITFIATFDELTEKGEILTSYKAFCGSRLLAEGGQGQRILPKEKIELLFSRLKDGNQQG